MKWNKLWDGISHMVLSSSEPISLEHVSCSSEDACCGGIYVCIKGTRQDGCTYLKEVWEKGCRCIVIDRQSCIEKLKSISADIFDEACVVLVADCRTAYTLLCRNLFGKPDEQLCMIGITGTKGKTTTAGMLYQMLRAAGIKAGQIGTCGAIWEGREEQLLCTTPDAYVLYELLSQMEREGVTHVVMEVSSQALKQKRVCGITYDVGVFTNLYPDHISEAEHADMEEYYYWKRQLFQHCKTAVLADPSQVPAASELYSRIDGKMPVFLVGSEACPGDGMDARYRCALTAPIEYIRYYRKPAQRLHLRMQDGTGFTQVLETPGTFQALNYLFAVTVLSALQLPVRGNLKLKPISGRMECVCVCKGACFYVDYAHNAEALKEALLSLRKFEPKHLVCVFGCGGNRSVLRRGPMGLISTTYADLTIVTEDNSREEAFSDICSDILSGMPEGHNAVEVIEERSLAIRRAVELAEAGDIVIIAGKGHENYMEKMGKRTFFQDSKEVKKYVRLCKYHH